MTVSSSSNIAESPWLADEVVELVLAEDVEELGLEDVEELGLDDVEDLKIVELVQLDVDAERAELSRCTEACTWFE